MTRPADPEPFARSVARNPVSDVPMPATDRDGQTPSESRVGSRLVVRGRVQGVGFRPFVVRLARQCGLTGRVHNDAAGVVIILEGTSSAIEQFRRLLYCDAPKTSQIDEITSDNLPPLGHTSFQIEPSQRAGVSDVRVPPDVAICPDCRHDILRHGDRRSGYAFTNCTLCGPRYSIIDSMPYDRAATAMRAFPLCGDCQREYADPAQRWFHAQPTACGNCGPTLTLWDQHGNVIAEADSAIDSTAERLRDGKIVAVKGLGGFQLLVRADCSQAVNRLRRLKGRPTKPFAVMLPSVRCAERVAELDDPERQLLASSQNPIVLLRRRASDVESDAPGSPNSHAAVPLALELAPHSSTLGFFLPTTPIHELLMSRLGFLVVATSGNRSDEPIVVDEREVVDRLGEIADAYLVHDRPIVRRVDDSVVRVIGGRAVTIRLARGLAPLPLPGIEQLARTRADCGPILATGGHQKVAIAAWAGSQAILSQHIGDLDCAATRTAFTDAVTDLRRLYNFAPGRLACDLHPEYFTTRWAESQPLPITRVQHHHAHAVAAMVQHDLLGREVLAVTWDGTGFGTDGSIWGGEFLRVRATAFHRVASVLPFPLPGGAHAIRSPNRQAFALLQAVAQHDRDRHAELIDSRLGFDAAERRLLTAILDRRINCPMTSSVGRLFDAVAALVLGVREVTYEGEAAAWLESAAALGDCGSYDLPVIPGSRGDLDGAIDRLDWRPMFVSILDDLAASTPIALIASRFHGALAVAAATIVAAQPLEDVVLSGGCFQNRLLTERTAEAIAQTGARVYTPGQIPPGDGGLAVGQLAVTIALHP